MKQTTPKKISLSNEALDLLESKRKSSEESYSDIVIRVIKNQKAKRRIRISDAGLQSMIREEIDDAKKIGEDYSGGYEW